VSAHGGCFLAKLLGEAKLLARHSAVYSVGGVLQQLSSIVMLPIYTTHLTPTDYGTQEIVGIVNGVLSILLGVAISSAFFRFYFEYDDEETRLEVLSTAAIALGGSGLVVLGGLAFANHLFAGVLLDDPGLGLYFQLAFAALWFQIVNNLFFGYLQAQRRSLAYVAFSLLRLLSAIGLNIYFVVVKGYGVLGIMLSTLVSGILVFLCLSVPIMWRIGLRFKRRHLSDMTRFGLPVILAELSATVVQISDRLFIKSYVSLAETGIYSLSVRIGTVPSQFISQPFNQTWLPRRLEIAREENSERIFGRIFSWFLALITLAGLAVSTLASDVLHIIADPKYWPAARVIPIIVLANIIFTMHYHFNIGILLEKKTAWLARINMINVVLVLLLNWLLIPTLVSLGAAIASLICCCVKSGLTYLVSRRLYKTHFEWTRVLKILLAAATSFGLVLLIHIDSPWRSLFVNSAIILASYPLTLGLLGFFTPEEIAWAAAFIRRRTRRSRRDAAP
jgi:O-antigen/teichoic acid export membrane protein